MATPRGIAIVGMSGSFAGSTSVDEFWRNLVEGRESVGCKARVEAPTGAAEAGHWVDLSIEDNEDELFDAEFFGISPTEADTLDPQHRKFLERAWEALEDGGYSVATDGPNVGVFGGVNFTSFFSLPPDAYLPVALEGMFGADKDYIATRISHYLGLQGPSLTIQSACSTSLVAVHYACQSLASGECDAALAGGVTLTRPRMSRYHYTPGGLLSPDGHCRAFDASARGTVFTLGTGMVLLMRLEDALKEAHPIYAVIRGSAVNNDGGGKASYLAPSVDGQERVIRSALKAAKVTAADITYVEGHGTGTLVGDAVELAALTRVFRSQTDKVGFCQLGSVKSNIGHTSAAAGVAGLMKTALALKHGTIPPNVNFATPNSALDPLISPFFVATDARSWPAGSSPPIAGINSFGVGGTNAHVVLQGPPVQRTSRARRSRYVLTLSAHSDTALATAAEQLRGRLKGGTRRDLADTAYTLNVGRQPLAHRATVICATLGEARRGLADVAAFATPIAMPRPGQRTVGFMFPGQGSQYVGMGAQLYRREPAFRATVDECVELLRRRDDLDLGPVFQIDDQAAAPPEDWIAQTSIAQPALFVFEYALGRLLMSWGVKPSYAIGHSVGEYAAACLAGVFALPDALHLVARRGALMQAMAPGAMLSVAASEQEISKLLSCSVSIAAVNAPRACVVSGPEASIEEMERALAAQDIHSVRLRTSHAFHSAMMEPMLEAFGDLIAQVDVRPPQFPFVSNLTGQVVSWDELRDPSYWTRQIREPVQFAAGLQSLVGRGVDVLIEVGPGRQLSSLAQQSGMQRSGVRVLGAMPADRVSGDEQLSLLRAISSYWMEGGAVAWRGLYGSERRRRIHLPAYPFERDRFRTAQNLVGALPPAQGKLDVSQWFYHPTWRRLAPMAARADEPVEPPATVVFHGSDHLGKRLAKGLCAVDGATVCVRAGDAFAETATGPFTVEPTRVEDFRQFFETLKAKGITPVRIVHAWSLEEGPTRDEDAELYDQRQRRGLFSLLKILHGFQTVFGFTPVKFEIVTSGVHEVTGAETLRPGLASMIAFAKVAPQEQANVACRVIDVESPESAGDADRIAQRIAVVLPCSTEGAMALRQSYWWAQAFERLLIKAETNPRLKMGGVYLITGGLGHVGLIMARRLAANWQARLVLVGRSTLPPEENWQALLDGEDTDPDLVTRIHSMLELKALGGEAVYISADVSDLESLRAARTAAIERFGAIDGVIFGAGRVDTGCGVDEVDSLVSYEENAAGKVHGLRNAMAVFGDDRLDFGLVLSSISTVLGGLALCPYSAANQVADVMVMQHRRGPGGNPWITSDWDLWAGGRFSDDVQRQLAHLQPLAIQADEGARALEAVLSLAGAGQMVISTHDLPTRIDQWVRSVANAGDASATAGAKHKRPNLATDYAAPEGELEAKLTEIWSLMLGVDLIGRDDDFFEMGGHSLLAVQTVAQIRRVLPTGAAPPNLYDTPTIRLTADALSVTKP